MSFGICLMTSNEYVEVATASLHLLQKFWPDHPRVHVVCRDRSVDLPDGANARVLPQGDEEDFPWSRALRTYLESGAAPELILFILDDYGINQPIDKERLAQTLAAFEDPNVGCVNQQGQDGGFAPETEVHPGCFRYLPDWKWTINSQSAIWRSSFLLKVLQQDEAIRGVCSVWEWEGCASRIYNGEPEPKPMILHGPVFFLYHNLVGHGQLREHSVQFLAEHGLSVKNPPLPRSNPLTRFRAAPRDAAWWEHINRRAAVLGESQHGEDGVLNHLLKNIPAPKVNFCVELGAASGKQWSITHWFRENGWSALLIDRYKYPEPVVHEFLTRENIGDVFERNSVPEIFDFLTIDIDGNEYWVWKGLPERYRPYLVVVEFNPEFRDRRTIRYDPGFMTDFSNYHGASLPALVSVAHDKGYSYLGVTGDMDAYFMRNDLLPPEFVEPEAVWSIWRNGQADTKHREWLILD